MIVGSKIIAGKVANNANFASESDIFTDWVLNDAGAGVGWNYDGSTFTAPSVAALPLSKLDAATEISDLYVRQMRRLSSKYTKEEIDTFHRKSTAATAYYSGAATDSHTYYLAKIDRVVNGATPLTQAEKAAEVAAIDAAGLAKVSERVRKILEAESVFDFYSAKIEQLRNTHLDQLVDGEDNQPVIDSLKATYGAIS